MTDHIPLSAAETALRNLVDVNGLIVQEEALDALRGVAGEAWQPIETAPKDVEVLLFGPLKDGSGNYMQVCKFFRKCWPVEWMHNTAAPTHWMPLPEPPTTSQKRGNSHE